ncbi:MAG: hypothetical protein ACXWCO_00645 [Caldimonas sp.]
MIRNEAPSVRQARLEASVPVARDVRILDVGRVSGITTYEVLLSNGRICRVVAHPRFLTPQFGELVRSCTVE